MKSATSITSSKIEWLASLRGLAAFLVFVSHLNNISVNSQVLFIIGRMGVVAFFLITGYLTLGSRYKRNRKQYALNRFVRLYPVYWLLLIITYIFRTNEISYIRLLANMTFFEEFVGFDTILGASWMMPIQVSFYFIIMIFPVSFFLHKESIKDNLKRGIILEIIFSILAFILALLRYFTEKPFPTAFFLLLNVAIIGVYIKLIDDTNLNIKTKIVYIIPFLIVFEFALVISTFFSYHEEWIFYEIAYNLGILLFILFKLFNKGKMIINKIFSELGRIGFTFFLGAGIPVIIFEKFFSFDSMNNLLVCLVKFILAFIFAELITWIFEKPVLLLGKKLEERI